MNLSVELRKIADILRLGPRPAWSFNDTIGRNGHLYMSFNEVGNRLQPEQVQKNLNFFSALEIVGIHPVGARLRPYFHSHQRNFSALAGIQMTTNTTPVVGFKVPEMDYPSMVQSVIHNTMVCDGNRINGQGNHLIMRAREQVVGEEVVCFGVEFANMIKYYMWDVDHIYPVDTTQPALFIRTKDQGLMLVSDAPQDYAIKDVLFGRVEWTNLNEDLSCNGQKIVVEIDAIKCEVAPEVGVTLEIKDGVARDNCRDAVFCGYKESDGFYTIGVESGVVLKEPPRTRASSPQEISISRKCVVSKQHLRESVVLGVKEKKFVPPFLNFKPEVSFAMSRNALTVKVPHLCTSPKGRVNKIDIVREYMQKCSSLANGIMRYVPEQLEGFLAANNFYIKRGSCYQLQYRPKQCFNEFGVSNYAVSGYCMVVYEDIPIVNKWMFAYRDFYILFYDPKIWKYQGEDRVDDFLDLNDDFMIK